MFQLCHDVEGADIVQEGTHAAVEVGIKSSLDVFQWLLSFFILQERVCHPVCLSLPVCLSMRKKTQTHANIHAREVACCLYAYPCSTTRRALACSSIFQHTQTHARALACCVCACPCANKREHTQHTRQRSSLLPLCLSMLKTTQNMFVNIPTHANTRQSTCLLPLCLSMLKHMQTHNRALACTTRVHGALETVQFYTGAAALPININLRMMHAQSMQIYRRTTLSSSWGV
jgi:hypothetical protein